MRLFDSKKKADQNCQIFGELQSKNGWNAIQAPLSACMQIFSRRGSRVVLDSMRGMTSHFRYRCRTSLTQYRLAESQG